MLHAVVKIFRKSYRFFLYWYNIASLSSSRRGSTMWNFASLDQSSIPSTRRNPARVSAHLPSVRVSQHLYCVVPAWTRHRTALTPKTPPPSPRSSTRSCTLLRNLPSSICFSSVSRMLLLGLAPFVGPPPSGPLTVSLLRSKAAMTSFPLPPRIAVFVAEVELAIFGAVVSGMR